MGLFSFIKKAGRKLLFLPDEEEKQAPKVQDTQKVVMAPKTKVDILKAEIDKLGIPISGLDIELSEMITVSGSTETNANREKIVIALGNTEGIGAVEDHITVTTPDEPEATFHVVEKGDTLSKISKAVYGDPMKYNVIFEANKPMLDHPDKIYPGQTLRIPAQA